MSKATLHATDGAGRCSKAEALGEAVTLLEGAALGAVAELTPAGVVEMEKLCEAIERRFRRHLAKCRICRVIQFPGDES